MPLKLANKCGNQLSHILSPYLSSIFQNMHNSHFLHKMLSRLPRRPQLCHLHHHLALPTWNLQFHQRRNPSAPIRTYRDHLALIDCYTSIQAATLCIRVFLGFHPFQRLKQTYSNSGINQNSELFASGSNGPLNNSADRWLWHGVETERGFHFHGQVRPRCRLLFNCSFALR